MHSTGMLIVPVAGIYQEIECQSSISLQSQYLVI
jgi:hypothetical protein